MTTALLLSTAPAAATQAFVFKKPKHLRKVAPTLHLTCKGCNLKTCKMSGHHYRQTSPGSRKLAAPGRSSTNTLGTSSTSNSSYDPYYASSAYARSPRDQYGMSKTHADRVGGGVIPISAETYVSYAPSSSSRSSGTSGTDPYSGRPRRSTLTDDNKPSLPARSRPISVVQGSSIARPSSPLSRSYDPDVWVKPSTTTRREHKKLYSVDAGSAKLIAETETDPRDTRDTHDARDTRESRGYLDADRDRARERRGYHLTGSRRLPPPIDESYSYTDAAGMYRDTEPSWRPPRRESFDRNGKSRPTSLIEPYNGNQQIASPARASTAREGPPPSTRGFDKINDALLRTGSLRDPARSSSTERRNTYDPYRNGSEVYDTPGRSSSTKRPTTVHQDDRYAYRDEYDDRKVSRSHRQFKDDGVETRGFGIRSNSVDDRYGSSSGDSLDNRRPTTTAPIVAGSTVAGASPQPPAYVPSTAVTVPDPRAYMAPPPPPQEDRRLSREDDWRATARDREYDRDYDRPREYDRHKHDSLSSALPAATTTAAAVAGALALKDRQRERKYEDEEEPRERHRDRRYQEDVDRPRERKYDPEEHRHGSRSLGPHEREDAREREYAQRDKRDDERKRSERRERDPAPALDPDEEYRRRIQLQQLELQGHQRQSSRDERSDESDRERRRIRRKERARERGDSDLSDEGDIGPRDAVRRDRDLEVQASQQHNRLPNVGDKDLVQSPIEMSKEAPLALAAALPGAYPPAAEQLSQALVAPAMEKSKSEPRVRIVEPAKEKEPEPLILKGILRKPTEKFPEDPNPIREGVAPLKDAKKSKGIPVDARWTKIDRKLVNPEALEEAKERFEERLDCVIVLRVLTREEIQKFADRTREIRGQSVVMPSWRGS
jgi:zinc finger CCCH domain-containing protein 13